MTNTADAPAAEPRTLPYVNDKGDVAFDREQGYDIFLDTRLGGFYVRYTDDRKLEHRTLSTLKKMVDAAIRQDARTIEAVSFQFTAGERRFRERTGREREYRYGTTLVDAPQQVKLMTVVPSVYGTGDQAHTRYFFHTPSDRRIDAQDHVVAPVLVAGQIAQGLAEFREREVELRARHIAEEQALVAEYDAWLATIPRVTPQDVAALRNPGQGRLA